MACWCVIHDQEERAKVILRAVSDVCVDYTYFKQTLAASFPPADPEYPGNKMSVKQQGFCPSSRR